MAMKRLLLAVAALMIALTGCSQVRENNDIGGLPALSPPADETAGSQEDKAIRAALYFQDSRTQKLTAEMRDITIGEGSSEAEEVLAALLKGPRDANLWYLGDALSLRGVEITEEVANVYIKSGDKLNGEEKFIIASAVTDTLADYFGVKYVSVFFNNRVLTIGGMPCGPLQKSNGEVAELYRQYTAKYTVPEEDAKAEPYEINAVLYFLDQSGSYLLPEVRKITVKGKDCINAVIEQLALGPKYKYYLKSYVRPDFIPSEMLKIERIGSTGMVNFEFAENPFFSASDNESRLSLSALYYSLAGLSQYYSSIECTVSGTLRSVSHESAAKYLGRMISICLPDKDYNSLKKVSRAVGAERSEALFTYIEELQNGPAEGEDELAPIFPEETTIEDVISASQSGTRVNVNLSVNFLAHFNELSEWKQSLMIYAIVNTLAGVENVKTVQFLIDGERVGDVGTRLNLYSPFMPNPGLTR